MISHKHKCIYIHIPKTAGMSIENSFIKSLGLKWVAGQCHPLLLTYNKNLGAGPQTLAHLSCNEYTKYSFISNELFSNYFKFTFVRNPYDRLLSIYRYLNYHKYISFSTFLNYEFAKLEKERFYLVKPQYDYIFNSSGKCLVDFIGKFENLLTDFNRVSEMINYPLSELEHINKHNNKEKFLDWYNLKFIVNNLKNKPYLLNKLCFKMDKNIRTRYKLNPVSKKFVKDYYYNDFEKFEYEY